MTGNERPKRPGPDRLHVGIIIAGVAILLAFITGPFVLDLALAWWGPK